MVVTLATSDMGESVSRPSNPYQYANICGKKLFIMDTLKRVNIILILVDILFLFGILFFSVPFLIFRCVMTVMGYWCLYTATIKDGNPRIMIFFVFNQFIDIVYTVFILMLIFFIGVTFSNELDDNTINQTDYYNIEAFLIISNLITIIFKTLFMGYYTKLYKLLLWQQEHINSIIATYTNSSFNSSNIYPNPPPNILIVPGTGEIIPNPHRSPLPTYNDVMTTNEEEKTKEPKVIEPLNLQTQDSIPNHETPTSPIENIDFVSTPHFQQVPLDDFNSIFDITQSDVNHTNNNHNNQESHTANQHPNDNEAPPMYHLPTNTKSTEIDNKNNDKDKDDFSNPFH
uniref:Ion_trans domain-containing protein n=1 Tax=Parastrongyloides trichosuri TaxID=131310 RepID=A0A0N4Z204_PARTI